MDPGERDELERVRRLLRESQERLAGLLGPVPGGDSAAEEEALFRELRREALVTNDFLDLQVFTGPGKGILRINGRPPIRFSARLAAILYVLALHRHRKLEEPAGPSPFVPSEDLADLAAEYGRLLFHEADFLWEFPGGTDVAREVHRLREAIVGDGGHHDLIETKVGSGYRLSTPRRNVRVRIVRPREPGE